MLTSGIQHWVVRGATVAVWALAAGSAVFWGLRMASSAPVSAPLALPEVAAPDPAAVARLLGARTGVAPVAEAPALAGRFTLTGVVADRRGEGAALVAIDGKPARPFKVGAQLAEGLWLLAVEPRQARVGPSPKGPVTLVLDLPGRQP